MNNLAVNAAERVFCPLVSPVQQSIYDYFAGNTLAKTKPETTGVCFFSRDCKPQKPYRLFNRSLEETPLYPSFRIIDHSSSLLTAWHSQSDKEPAEFELLDLRDMQHENIMWLRASGEFSSLTVDKAEKLLAMVYHDEKWRIDIRRSENFQLREVVHHTLPVNGVLFYEDVMFSLSNKLIASFPEDRRENNIICSSEKILGWAQHPTEPYLVLIEPEQYRIIDLSTQEIVKSAEWTKQIKWFNLLQKYSNHSFAHSVEKSTAVFSTDGNRLFIGGYGKLVVFNWHDMLRPRCLQPEPESMLDIHSDNYSTDKRKKVFAARIINMVPINRDRLLCVTDDGYLIMLNIRTGEVSLLLTPGNGVRMNSLQLCADNKYLAMTGYYYGFDNKRCNVESALLIWKLSRLVNGGVDV